LILPHHHVAMLLEIPVDLLLPMPRWIEGTEVIVEITCDQVQKCYRFATLIFAILRLASVRLHHPLDLISLTLFSSRVSPSRTWYTCCMPLLIRSWHLCCSYHRKFFVFYATNLSVVWSHIYV
jgi:hypothetical protein